MTRLAMLVGVVTSLLCSVAAASCNSQRCIGPIKKLMVQSNAVYVLMDVDMSPLNCTLTGGGYATLQNSHANRDQLFSLLLAAHAKEASNVFLRVSEGTTGCNIAYAISTLE